MTLRLLTAGESHGPALTAILEGIPAGLPLTREMIDRDLARRQKGTGAGPRMALEHDTAQLLSGVMEGVTTGAPLSFLIQNLDHARWRGKAVKAYTVPRPGHADLAGAVKYGFNDLRPVLERASARETAARVAAGAVCRQLLSIFSVRVEGYVSAIGGIQAGLAQIPLEKRAALAEASDVACPDTAATTAMLAAIEQAKQDRDTLGGVIEALVFGLPPGLGAYTQWDRRLDARIGAALLSIPAVKGVEIGPAFENAGLRGTQVHDAVRLEGSDLVRDGLRSGGLEGGVTTGQPLWVRCAVKPIPTTLTPQRSVDLAAGAEVQTNYERSDFCPVPRAVMIVEAMLAFVLADAVLEKLGGDSIAEMLPRFQSLRRANLDDLHMTGEDHIFWTDGDAL